MHVIVSCLNAIRTIANSLFSLIVVKHLKTWQNKKRLPNPLLNNNLLQATCSCYELTTAMYKGIKKSPEIIGQLLLPVIILLSAAKIQHLSETTKHLSKKK
jgi:hypothetical protein